MNTTLFPQRELPKIDSFEPCISEKSETEAVFDFKEYLDQNLSKKYYDHLVYLVK